MNDFSVFASRGPIVESSHDVAVAVVDAEDRLVASAGDIDLVTFWRSAAKPFQVMPLIEDGGVDRWRLDTQMLALACGSHNAEPFHLAAGARWLATLGLTEEALSCGGHQSLWVARAEEMIRNGISPTPLWSNCSGKHAALLAFAQQNGWPISGYQELGHPVQDRVSAVFAEWSGLKLKDLTWGVDGCTAAAVALPLRSMALAYARLGSSNSPAAKTLRDAMMSEPLYVAGTDRIDSVLMRAWPGRIVVKAGAEGVFCAALPELGLGISLKVLDGEMRSAALALVRVLELVTQKLGQGKAWPMEQLAQWRDPDITNTRGAVTGKNGVAGELRFL